MNYMCAYNLLLFFYVDNTLVKKECFQEADFLLTEVGQTIYVNRLFG